MSSSDDELGRLAKQRIKAGELPCNASRRMWGSRGTGAPCSLCGRPIRLEDVEYEVEIPEAEVADAEAAQVVLRFHLACHAVWQSECVRVGNTCEARPAGAH